jgi:membrane-associated protease RseP (regulator of RpoE activity)
MSLALALTLSAASPAHAVKYIHPLGATVPGQEYAIVLNVEPNSPAAAVGLAAGDTLFSINGTLLQQHGDLLGALQQLPHPAEVQLALGTKAGRRDASVQLRKQAPRLGVSLTGGATNDKLSIAADLDVTVFGYVSEWSGLTVVRVDVLNRGNAPISFGPDSVSVISGTAELQTAMSPDQVLAMKYGGRITDVASSVPGSMAEAIVGGASAGIAQGMRENTTKSIYANALKNASIPPSTRHGGAIFIGRNHVPQPVTVRVTVAGRSYSLQFGDRQRN